MQGLGALEYVLFGTGSESLGRTGRPLSLRLRPGGRAKHRRHGERRARCMAGARTALRAQWANARPDNPLYHNDDEAMTELFNVFVHGLEMIRDVRLNGFLGDDARRRQAEAGDLLALRCDDRLARRQYAMACEDCSRPRGSAWKAAVRFGLDRRVDQFRVQHGRADVRQGRRPDRRRACTDDAASGLQAFRADHLASVGTVRRQLRRRAGPDGRVLVAGRGLIAMIARQTVRPPRISSRRRAPAFPGHARSGGARARPRFEPTRCSPPPIRRATGAMASRS